MKTVSINEAARRKDVTRQTIHAAIKAGRIRAVDVPRIAREVVLSSLEAFEPNPQRQAAGRTIKARATKRKGGAG